jgi:uncharacterized protein (TIGR03382 family)
MKQWVFAGAIGALALMGNEARADWELLPAPNVTGYDRGCNAMQALDANTVLIAGLGPPVIGQGFTPAFIKTTDGGLTWSGGSVTQLGTSLTGRKTQVHFANATVGYMAWDGGGTKIAVTTNGGTSWTQTNVPAGAPAFVWALDATTALASGTNANQSTIWRTTNNGTTWTPVSTGTTGTAGGRIIMFDGSVGVAQGGSTGVVRTVDGGQTWSPVNNPMGLGLVNGPWSRVSSTEAFILGSSSGANRLYRTGDAGQTFAQVGNTLPCAALSVAFRDSMHGLLGCSSAQSMGRNLYTSDGGLTWTNEAWPAGWNVMGSTSGNGATCMVWPAANAAYANNDGAPTSDVRSIKRTGDPTTMVDGAPDAGVSIDAPGGMPGDDAGMGGGGNNSGGDDGGCNAGGGAGATLVAAGLVLVLARRRRT